MYSQATQLGHAGLEGLDGEGGEVVVGQIEHLQLALVAEGPVLDARYRVVVEVPEEQKSRLKTAVPRRQRLNSPLRETRSKTVEDLSRSRRRQIVSRMTDRRAATEALSGN